MKVIKLIAYLFIAIYLLPGFAYSAGMNSDPMLGYFLIDKAELRYGASEDEPAKVWEVEGWLGYDLNKFWLKSDGEVHDGETAGNSQVLYSHAIAPYWDLQTGLRFEHSKDVDQKTWLGLGLKGLAPYFFETEAFGYFNDKGWLFEVVGEYEVMLTQKLILTPEIELAHYGVDVNQETSKGDTSMEAGLRLRYEFIREFGLYLGLNWEGLLNGENSLIFNRTAVAGLRAWF